MAVPKTGKSSNGKDMHYSVGAVIKRGEKILLVDRAIEPLGFAGPAGHVDVGEDDVGALKREVKEETGFDVTKLEKILEEERENNVCSKGIKVHYWKVFRCEVSGDLKENERETKSIGWHNISEIKDLKLEPIWEYWFKKAGYV